MAASPQPADLARAAAAQQQLVAIVRREVGQGQELHLFAAVAPVRILMMVSSSVASSTERQPVRHPARG